MTAPPLFSIITPCYNRAGWIGEAVESVLQQGDVSYEHIVMDGGSTDGTLELLREYPHLRVVSEPDRGMYDAINKGIHLAQGEVIGLLNSDDRYAAGIFTAAAACFAADANLDALCGGAEMFSGAFATRRVIRANRWIEAEQRWQRLLAGAPVTNAWFFRRRVFEQIGLFDDRYRYTADRDFLIRFALSRLSFCPLRKTVYHYRQHEGSFTISAADSRSVGRAETRMQVLQEGIEVSERHLANPALPGAARLFLRRYHTDRSYRLAATALYHRRWRLALEAARRGQRYDPLWGLAFAALALERLTKPLRKSIAGKRQRKPGEN